MATAEQVAELNESGQLVPWTPYYGSAVCPACGGHEIDVRQVFKVTPPGKWSLAGVQRKYPARITWEYRCNSCGDTGPAEPK